MLASAAHSLNKTGLICQARYSGEIIFLALHALTVLVVVPVFVVVVGYFDVLVVQLVLGLPGHLVLLLQSSPSVGEPRANLKRLKAINRKKE